MGPSKSFCDPVIIGIHGKSRSGKSTLAEIIRNRCPSGHIMYFSDPLKNGFAAMLGLSKHACNHGDREKPLTGYRFSIRQALQVFGTEAGRALDPDIWIRRLEERIEDINEPFPLVIVPDVRFDNEAAWVRRHGVLLFVHRPETDNLSVGNENHASEKGLLPRKDEIIINNDGNRVELSEKIHSILGRILRDARSKSL